MMSSYEKRQKLHDQIKAWGYTGVQMISAMEDGVVYISEKVLKDHPEIPEQFSLMQKAADKFFNNERLQALGQAKLAFYL